MRVQGSTDYALRALIELAIHGTERPLSAEELGGLQGISTGFLRRILAELARAGIVTGVRGHAGGWVLARAVPTVSVAEVMRAVNGPLVSIGGVPPENLHYNATAAPLREVWLTAEDTLRALLEHVTLEQLIPVPALGSLPPAIESPGRVG